jgi:4-azaleucine resistance transporter AzlC
VSVSCQEKTLPGLTRPISSRRSEFIAGVKAAMPVMIGVMSFGTISGVATVESGIPADLALYMHLFVFAGSVQLPALQMITSGTATLIIFLTAFVIASRMAMYSASLAPHFKGLSTGWKWLLAYLITDPAYAISIMRYRETPQKKYQHWFYFGIALTLWWAWQLSSAAGIFLGTRVPDSWSLDFAVPLIFIALVVPAVTDRATLAAAAVAGVVAVGGINLPFNSSLIVAAFVGIVVGLWVESKQHRRTQANGE